MTTADSGELSKWSGALLDATRKESALRNVASETQTGGLRSFVKIDRENMGRLASRCRMSTTFSMTHSASGRFQRFIRNQISIASYSKPRSSISATRRRWRSFMSARLAGRAGSAGNLRSYRHCKRAALCRASGAISGGDNQFRSRQGCLSWRRPGRHRANRTRNRHALHDTRNVLRRRRGVP